MKNRCLVVGLLISLESAGVALAHPYLPLEGGRVTVLDYTFRVENPKIRAENPGVAQALQPVRGKIIVKTGEFEEKFGRRYLRQATSYRDIPYMKVDQLTWRREENGNVYFGSMLHGRWNETLELPADVSVGREWDYYDGEKSKRKVTRKLEIKLPGGEVLPDCIEIARTILKNERLANVVNKNYYCRDKGDAGSVFLQPSPVGDYTTETKARSFEAATEGKTGAR